MLASVSNPKFKFDFIESNLDCNIVKEMLISECKLFEENSNSFDSNDDTENNSPPDDFYISFSNRRDTRRRSFEILIEEEVNRYSDDNRTEYSMLNEYPRIKRVFFRHNTTLTASAAVERVFSQSEMIFAPRRNRLQADNFERVILLKHNRKQLISN